MEQPLQRKRGRRAGPHPMDIHAGGRLRVRRVLLGMSQEKLGDGLGLTFQQVQKYERGANRMGASRLYEISRILDVPPAYFFEDYVDPDSNVASLQDAGGVEPLTKRETLELVRAYYRISSPRIRKRLFELTKSIARVDDAQDESGQDGEGIAV